ncbi:MAG: N-acetyltransferase [Lachnospiraceae bacterium]|nr:N-acetyltransferase [Lachnospiraceae bacterium]
MIRKFEKNDLDEVMSIWMNANIEAHSFIEADYWKRNFDSVRKMIPEAEVFVSEIDGEINGFIGMIDHYIAGIFVRNSDRSKGIGTSLLHTVKQKNETLSLQVYKNNKKAVLFYQNAGFKIAAEEMDEDTSEMEYKMVWYQGVHVCPKQ